MIVMLVVVLVIVSTHLLKLKECLTCGEEDS